MRNPNPLPDKILRDILELAQQGGKTVQDWNNLAMHNWRNKDPDLKPLRGTPLKEGMRNIHQTIEGLLSLAKHRGYVRVDGDNLIITNRGQYWLSIVPQENHHED